MVIETLTSSEQTHILNLVKDVLGETNMNANVNEMNTLNSAFDADETVKPTQQELYQRFVNIYLEIYTLNEDVKQLSEEVKENYPDTDLVNMKKVAKMVAEQKVGESVTKANEFLEAVDEFTKQY